MRPLNSIVRRQVVTSLPEPVSEALGTLVADLAERGFTPVLDLFSPESFGNFVVTFVKGEHNFSLTSDRGQLIVSGSEAKLTPLGLWKAFAGPYSLRKPLLAWLDRVVV